MTKKEWQDDYENIKNLYLDLKNPRVPEHARLDEDSIVEYLLENEDIMEIAKNIAINGYHRSAVSIVCTENRKRVILDGNRRLAACKLLLDPSLTSGIRRKTLEKLQGTANLKELKSIKITIAPSRKDAEKEISDIHINILMKPWQVIQKLRKYEDLIRLSSSTLQEVAKEYGITKGKMLKELAKLNMYEKILPFLGANKEKAKKLVKPGFNKIERILIPEHGQSFLGYKIKPDSGEVEIKDKKIFTKNLKKIVPDILDNKKLGPQCTKDEVEDRFVELMPSYIKQGEKLSSLAINGEPSAKSETKLSTVKKRVKKEEVKTKDVEKIYLPIPTHSKNNLNNKEALMVINHLCKEFDSFCEQLKSKSNGKQTISAIEIKNEYDVQYLFHALLKLFFDDIRDEEATPSYLSGSSRMDFLLVDNDIVVEIKKTRPALDNKKLKEELIIDIEGYQQHKNCKRLICFVYDPDKIIKNPKQFERDIENPDRGEFEIYVLIVQ